MAFFDQNHNTQQAQPYLPVEQVRQMKAQGMDNNKIITSLQADGFSTSQIFDAMSVADTNQVPSDVNKQMNNQTNDQHMNQNNDQNFHDLHNSQNNQSPQTFNPSQNFQDSQNPQNSQQFSPQPVEFQQNVSHNSSSELSPSNEELIEAIIDEKWNDLVDDINKIIDWKNRADSRLSVIETSLKNLRNEFNNLHQGVLGRISDYDKNMLNVGAELKAMESMFSKVLPGFMDNVQKLDDITGRLNNKKKFE